MLRILPLIVLFFLCTSCDDFDSTKIIAPTDFQIEAVSLNLDGNVLPTNVAAQKVDENSQYTLVGATLKRDGEEIVGIWMFDENDPNDIKSINETALTYSPFPRQNTKLKITSEARNLSAFLKR